MFLALKTTSGRRMNPMDRVKLRPEHPFTLEGPCIGTAKGQEDPARLWQMSGTPAMGAAFPPTPPTPPPTARGSEQLCRPRGGWAAGAAGGRAAQRGGAAPAPGTLRAAAICAVSQQTAQQGSIATPASADSDLPRLAPRPCATPAAPDQGATAATDWPGPHRPGAAGSCAGREAERVARKRRVRACTSARRHWQQCHECIYCAIRDHRCSVRRHHGSVSAEGSSQRLHAG